MTVAAAAEEVQVKDYAAILSVEELRGYIDRILAGGQDFGIDIEAGYHGPEGEGIALQPTHPNWILVGFSFTDSLDWARYVPVAHDDGYNIDDPVGAARELWRLLRVTDEQGQGYAVAHNMSFEQKGLSRWFRETLAGDPEVEASQGFFPYLTDSLVEAFLTGWYHPLRVGQDLKSLTLHIFGHKMTKYDELFPELKPGKQMKLSRFNTRSARDPKVVNYACEDALWCLAVKRHCAPTNTEERPLLQKIERKLIRVLTDMEHEGMVLDWAEISRRAAEVKTFAEKMNEEIQRTLSERLGRTVALNLSSVKQLQEVLFDPEEGLGLPIKERSEKTGAPSTSEGALRAIAQEDPVVRKILKYREVVKLYGSYLHKYETELNYTGNGRAYPNHKQTGAITGRMSVEHVPYQQWPKKYHYELEDGTSFDLVFRNLAPAPKGFRIVGFDWSQVELRVLSGLANETAMFEAFVNDTDIHKATAATMMKISLDEVTSDIRARGKTMNFAIVYGSGPANIADMLSTPERPVSVDEAKKMLEDYYAAFPALRAWMDACVVEGHQQGYVTTMFGRRVTIWEYESPLEGVRKKGDRLCVNAKVQGAAADLMKVALVRIHKKIHDAGMQDKIRMVMTVHDALEMYVHDSVSTQEVIDLLGPEASFPVPNLPPIRADWHEGDRWGSVAEVVLGPDMKILGWEVEKGPRRFVSMDEYRAWLADPEGWQDDAAPAQEMETAYLTLPKMPTPEAWKAARAVLTASEPRPVVLFTPQGTKALDGVGLDPARVAELREILPGCSVVFHEGSPLSV